MTQSVPDSVVLDELQEPVFRACAVVAGLQLDLFTQLNNGPLSASQIADAIGVQVTKLRPLLYALVVTGLLSIDDELFENTSEADYYLVRGAPGYVGENRAGFLSDIFTAGLQTAETIRMGTPQAEHDFSAMPPEKLETFLLALHPASVEVGRTFASQFDFSSYRTLLDIGGGTGGLAIAMTDAYPDLQVTIAELPTVVPITERIVAEAAGAQRIHIEAVDVVRDKLTGSFDGAVMKSFIQALSAEEARLALRNISQVIAPGGRILIKGQILDNSRLSPSFKVLFNLVFLNIYKGGQIHTEREHLDWLVEAGFEDIERMSDVINARKA